MHNEHHAKAESPAILTALQTQSWLLYLKERLTVLRKISLTDKFLDIVCEELGKRNFTLTDAMTAEQWILGGSWQYKKTYQLELCDFFPTKDQLITTTRRYVPLEIAQEREKGLRQEITRLKQENERIANESSKKHEAINADGINKQLSDLALKATAEKLELQKRITELEKIIRQSNKHYFLKPKKHYEQLTA